MMPVPNTGIGALQLPELPPTPSGPNPSGPQAFNRLYDRMLTDVPEDVRGLPTAMEVSPVLAPAGSLSEPFKASPEFPGAVDPNSGLRISGMAKMTDAESGLTNFLSPLKQGLDQVNRAQFQAADLANEAAIGGDVDLHDVMIASEKAGVAMQLTLQIRNKIVEAYQDVMRMQV